MFDSIRTLLEGKKTYLVMAGLIVTALIKYAGDGNIGELVNTILIAIGGVTIKAGINRVENK